LISILLFFSQALKQFLEKKYRNNDERLRKKLDDGDFLAFFNWKSYLASGSAVDHGSGQIDSVPFEAFTDVIFSFPSFDLSIFVFTSNIRVAYYIGAKKRNGLVVFSFK